MNHFNKLNKILGWVTFIIALVVYTLTLERSVSLWDCGEFIAAADKLQVVHPPGAPFFLMLGKIFTLFASKTGTAFAVNFLSAMASAGCVMFTFWITTYFASRMVGEDNPNKNLVIFGAGIVAALSNTFLDSFWFSAVEGEVYALSSFFTALTFWAVLRWQKTESKDGKADRWLVFIAFVTGLALGTHMLNLLVIPTICLAIYFKKDKIDILGIFKASLGAIVALVVVMKIIYPGIPWLLAAMDRMFVNDFGLRFYSGGIFAIFLIVAACIGAIFYTHKSKRRNLNLISICITFVILGYSSYAMVVIRSLANPSIDMNDPEDFNRFYGYITREQYGDRPLVKGPYFNVPGYESAEPGSMRYYKDSTKYEEAGARMEYEWPSDYSTFFPRMGPAKGEYDNDAYRSWSGMDEAVEAINVAQSQLQQARSPQEKQQAQQSLAMAKAEPPTFGNNLQYFFSYQINHMYLRYFWWNFIGRANDNQAHGYSNQFEGNWQSGIGFIDNMFGHKTKDLPDEYKKNKARNSYYFLPLILGMIGLFYHLKKSKKDFWLTMLLFLFTGILINVYMNQPPNEPRERDYALVGSFQTFCIWIGLGIIFIDEILRKALNRNSAIVAVASCTLLVPVNMGYQGWDDHNRSGRSIGIDLAKNFLNSMDPNALLICNGDNDTYPLWYAHNAEEIRPDLRIVNMALLSSDWYSMQLLNSYYKSAPLPMTLTKKHLNGGRFEGQSSVNKEGQKPQSLRNFINNVKAQLLRGGEPSLAGDVVYIPVDKDAVIKAGIVSESDRNLIDSVITFKLPSAMTKSDIALYDFICTNAETGWKRPLYFTSVSGNDFNNLNEYLQLEGLVYKFVPIRGGAESQPGAGLVPKRINEEKFYNNYVNLYRYFGIKENPNFFLDEKATYMPTNMRDFAATYIMRVSMKYQMLKSYQDSTKKGKTMPIPEPGFKNGEEYEKATIAYLNVARKRAIDIIKKLDIEIPDRVLPYKKSVQMEIGIALLHLGEEEMGKKFVKNSAENCIQTAKYMAQFPTKSNTFRYGLSESDQVMRFLMSSSNSLPQYASFFKPFNERFSSILKIKETEE